MDFRYGIAVVISVVKKAGYHSICLNSDYSYKNNTMIFFPITILYKYIDMQGIYCEL